MRYFANSLKEPGFWKKALTNTEAVTLLPTEEIYIDGQK